MLAYSWPIEVLPPEIAVSKRSEHMPLNRQAEVMARHGVQTDRTVLSNWMGRTGQRNQPVVDHMAKRLLWESTSLFLDETTVLVLGPRRGKTKTGYLWAILHDDCRWNGSTPSGMVFHYRSGRKGEDATEILDGFNGTIQVDAHSGYSHLATLDRTGGKPIRLAFCWAHGRRKLIKTTPKTGSPFVEEVLIRIAALYNIKDSIRGSDPEHRWDV